MAENKKNTLFKYIYSKWRPVCNYDTTNQFSSFFFVFIKHYDFLSLRGLLEAANKMKKKITSFGYAIQIKKKKKKK